MELCPLVFKKHAESILSLRYRYLDPKFIYSPLDESGVHLGLMVESQLVGVVSGYTFDTNDPACQHIKLTKYFGVNNYFQISRLVINKNYRKHSLAKFLGSALIVFSNPCLLNIDYYFQILYEPQFNLRLMYAAWVGFKYGYIDTFNEFGRFVKYNVNYIDRWSYLKKYYQIKAFFENFSKKHNIQIQPFTSDYLCKQSVDWGFWQLMQEKMA